MQCILHARRVLYSVRSVRHVMYSRAQVRAQQCWHAPLYTSWSVVHGHCVELFNWNSFFFLCFRDQRVLRLMEMKMRRPRRMA